MDQTSHAALPWAAVKSLITLGFKDVDQFSSLVEGIEAVSGLLARYTVIEKLYLCPDSPALAGRSSHTLICRSTAVLVQL